MSLRLRSTTPLLCLSCGQCVSTQCFELRYLSLKSCWRECIESQKQWLQALIRTAVQIAMLTVNTMCKAVDRGMAINNCKLLEKDGGKSGSFVAG